ncbi:MAG TPA: ADOP family duplicated permease [Gemmatimonadaceae bacterium]|nr:ADOP family duplicated permease [Gemmatimonadaceae bacterium]
MDPRSGVRRFRLRPRGRDQVEAEMRTELDVHLAMAVEHYVARGMSREEAERLARERFGDDLDATRRRLYRSAGEREARVSRRETLHELRQDARLAVRLFRRAPRFFAAAVLTLAIGIGANGAVFGILRATLLQALPYERPDELVMLWRAFPDDPPAHRGELTTAMLLAWRRELAHDVGDVAGLITWDGNVAAQFDLVSDGRARRLNGAFATPNFFGLLDVQAARGRVFGPGDERSGEPLVVLSDALWRREFGGDPSIVGRRLTLTVGTAPRAPRTFTVLGILPRGVHFTYPDETEAWVMMPWAEVARREPGEIAFQAVARLRPGVTLTHAQQRASALRLPTQRRAIGSGAGDVAFVDAQPRFRLEPMHDWVVGDVRPSLQLLGAVAALLLLVTCVTVANGLLARISERQQELSVRAALGAGRGRLVRQLLTEGALLAVAGAAAGTAIAAALQPVLRALLPVSVPRVGELTVSGAMVGFGATIAAVTTLLAAVAPAWGGTRVDGAARLTQTARGASADRAAVRWRHGLVGAQAAIATTLLVFATLLLASFWRLGQVPLGFDGREVLTVEMRLLDPKYRQSGALERFQTELAARVRAIPGVARAGLASAVPFRGVDIVTIVGRADRTTQLVNARYVDRAYFDVMHIPLRRGRLFGDADRDGPPGVVISESLANTLFHGEDPIGQRLLTDEPHEVVGVVGDVRYDRLERDPWPAVYVSRAQSPRRLICLVVRTRRGVPTTSVAPAIRRAIHAVDPAVPAMRMTTIDRIVDASVANRRFYTLATTAFASIALLLTIVGLATVVARVVAERRRELAIRAALGATTGELARQATWGAMAAVGVGTLVGLAVAYAGSAALTQFLFHVAPRAPATYAAVAALVLTVAVVAAWRPVRALARVPLARVLRAE